MCQMLTVNEAAEICEVKPATIRNRWIPSGYIKCIRLLERPKSPIRIPKTEVERILNNRMKNIQQKIDKLA